MDTIAATGEPPNHVQTAYFGQLARAMAARGATAGLCGEGADSLFGVTSMYLVQNAAVLRRLLPLGPARRWGARLAARVGWQRLGSKVLIDATAPPTSETDERAVFSRIKPPGDGEVRLEDFL